MPATRIRTTRTRGARFRPVAAATAAALVGALLVASASGVPASADPPSVSPQPGFPVPTSQAGEVVVWGNGDPQWENSQGQMNVPAALNGVAVRQVVGSYEVFLALTAAGNVVAWGANTGRVEVVPPALTTGGTVAQIAVGTTDGYAGAVTKDGKVVTWGRKSKDESPLNVPAGLTDVVQLAIGSTNAIALKSDGTVVAWGSDYQPEFKQVPDGLHAQAITMNAEGAYALTTDGTVAGWGPLYSGADKIPAAALIPGNVKAVAQAGGATMALLADDSLISWTSQGTSVAVGPPSVTSAHPVAIAGGNSATMLDEDGVLHEWNLGTTAPENESAPATLTGKPLAQFQVAGYNGSALVTKMLTVTPPSVVAGAGVVQATPATFSGAPDAVSGEWFVDGVGTGNHATSLPVTPAMGGKPITYVSTATKAGQDPASSTSNAVVLKSNASVSVSASKGTYGGSATVTVTVAGATGDVAVKVDGTTIGTKALAGGKAAFSVARTTAPGNHAVQVSYGGSTGFNPAAATATLSVAKARTGTPGIKVTKKASPKKAGAVTVTVPTGSGLVKATGTAVLVLKKGKSAKTVRLVVRNGVATGKLPKLPKGTWTAVVTYQGSGYYLPIASRAVKVKSK